MKNKKRLLIKLLLSLLLFSSIQKSFNFVTISSQFLSAPGKPGEPGGNSGDNF